MKTQSSVALSDCFDLNRCVRGRWAEVKEGKEGIEGGMKESGGKKGREKVIQEAFSVYCDHYKKDFRQT